MNERASPRLPGIWRRKQTPGCPGCGAGPRLAQHASCPDKQAVWDNEACLYIDIATGRLHCIACGADWPFERTRYYCGCGAVRAGGEIWQGMAAETVSMGDLSWFRAAGISRGSAEITFFGWSFCPGCRRTFDKETGFLLTGTRKGGICETCHDQASKRLGAWFTFSAVKKSCSWCGSRRNRGRIVTVGKARLCRLCSEEIAVQRVKLSLKTALQGG